MNLNDVVDFFFQAEDGIRDLVRSRGLGDVYKRQVWATPSNGSSTSRKIRISLFMVWVSRGCTRKVRGGSKMGITGPDHHRCSVDPRAIGS